MDERELRRRFDEMRETIAFFRQGVWQYVPICWILVLAILILLLIAFEDTLNPVFELLFRYIPNMVFVYGVLALCLSFPVAFYVRYRRRRAQIRQRCRAMADRAVPVDCTVGETHVFDIRHGGYKASRKYYPAVEFEYERDGTTHQSVYAYPDGFTYGSGDLQRVEHRARELASEADGTAYFDPVTEQAFLSDELQTQGLDQWSGEIGLYLAASIGPLVILILFILVIRAN